MHGMHGMQQPHRYCDVINKVFGEREEENLGTSVRVSLAFNTQYNRWLKEQQSAPRWLLENTTFATLMWQC
eukprot:m.1666509 g.1666509  ORF g.1666509 m.1666509 type:complete len:71 (+) comp145184_c0_seq1:49-261(+)